MSTSPKLPPPSAEKKNEKEEEEEEMVPPPTQNERVRVQTLSSSSEVVSVNDEPNEEGDHRTEGKDTLPKYVLLRYRMGYTTLKLSDKQRERYTWNDVEDFIMYKEQKYNSVNILSRFVTFLLLLMCITVFCQAFSMSSTDWLGIRYVNHYSAMGVFVRCEESSYQQCTTHLSAYYERVLYDSVTGEVVCAADNSNRSRTKNFAVKYIGAMWSMGILSLALDAISIVLLFYLSCRPTRSHTLVVIVLALLLATIADIIVCVLFSVYVSCDRKTCHARRQLPASGQLGVDCEVSYLWGFKVYIAVVVLHFVSFLVSFCMHNAILNIRVNTRRQLQEARRQRRRQQQQSASLANYVLDEVLTPEEREELRQSLEGSRQAARSRESKGNTEEEYEIARLKYLTAQELGLQIPGADDWLYDERSDMYYSFQQNSFWDPLTSEYFNCTLGVWQEELGHMVEVRDVLEYTVKGPPLNHFNEREEEGAEAHSPASPSEDKKEL